MLCGSIAHQSNMESQANSYRAICLVVFYMCILVVIAKDNLEYKPFSFYKEMEKIWCFETGELLYKIRV